MALESGTFVQDLQQTNPPGTDKKKQGDDHLRLIKDVLKNTFPNATRAVRFARARAVSVSGNIVASDQNALIVADATAGAVALSLPTLAAGDDGWVVTIVKADASANAVSATGTVNGAVNPSLGTRYRQMVIVWSGTAWFGYSTVSAEAQVTTGLLADNAVTNAKMADDAINTAEILNLAVTSGKLADNSVTTAKVLDANVTNPKLVGPRKTVQFLIAGTSYTTPANCKSLHITMIGGGAGGGASGSGTGATGGTTTFNSVDAAGGVGGAASNNGNGGTGGTGGGGSANLRLKGSGGSATAQMDSSNNQRSGVGGAGIFGTGGAPSVFNAAGVAGGTNTGAGGSGGSSSNQAGSGGGAGEHVEILIQSPAASYTYAIGAGGVGGSGSGNAGGAGGSGIIIVEEYY